MMYGKNKPPELEYKLKMAKVKLSCKTAPLAHFQQTKIGWKDWLGIFLKIAQFQTMKNLQLTTTQSQFAVKKLSVKYMLDCDPHLGINTTENENVLAS